VLLQAAVAHAAGQLSSNFDTRPWLIIPRAHELERKKEKKNRKYDEMGSLPLYTARFLVFHYTLVKSS